MTTVYDFSAPDLYGREIPLSTFKNQVLLIVNTASHCGFTPQYAGLNDLHKALSPRGFSVLAFPCNQFGEQEPGDAATIERFCRTIYDIRFPIFAKIAVNGPKAHPLYRWLKRERRGFLGTSSIKWNFTKFLVDRDGRVVKRLGSIAKPSAIRPRIEKVLID
ncbi:MAG TPA: glutathione peroxidase [Dongiaceae bacterium]|nr:glutathione peroxidase [Dongiaceae bacterium]